MSITIYHNPACGTSRNTLAMIRASGTEPTVIEYHSERMERAGKEAAAGHSISEARTG